MSELARLVQMLCAAEAASADGASLIEFSPGQAKTGGALVAEKGRICWAAARSQSTRIGDIFAEECGINRDELEETFRTAQEMGRPFGEELLRRGGVKGQDLQRCLRRQTLAAVLAILKDWTGEAWSGQEMDDAFYDPAFTIAPLELLEACITALRADEEESVRAPSRSLSALAERSGSAVCFRETGSVELPLAPVCWFGANSLSIHQLLSLGRNALGVARPVALVAASVHPHAVLIHLDGNGVVCALDSADLWVFEVGHRAQYGEIMAHLQALARSRG